jgi:hypothetical protein
LLGWAATARAYAQLFHILELHTPSGTQAAARVFDPPQKSRIVFETGVERIVFGFGARHDESPCGRVGKAPKARAHVVIVAIQARGHGTYAAFAHPTSSLGYSPNLLLASQTSPPQSNGRNPSAT